MDQTTFLFVKCILEYGFIVSCLIGNIAMFLYKIYDYKNAEKNIQIVPLLTVFHAETPKDICLLKKSVKNFSRL